jgi:hypothetical protein
LLAAAAFWSVRFTAADFLPGFGLQLPWAWGALPGTGSKPGQQREVRFAVDGDFFCVGMLGLEGWAEILSAWCAAIFFAISA